MKKEILEENISAGTDNLNKTVVDNKIDTSEIIFKKDHSHKKTNCKNCDGMCCQKKQSAEKLKSIDNILPLSSSL